MNFREPPPKPPLLVFADRVTAIERETGKWLWEYGKLESDEVPPLVYVRRFVVEGDRLFVLDAKSVLHCLHVFTGQLLGRVELELPKVGSNLLIDGPYLYAVATGMVIALDLEGRVLWRTPFRSEEVVSIIGIGVPGGNLSQPDYFR